MVETTICNVCDRPQGIDQADALVRVPSNVRAHRHETFTLWRCGHCRSLHSREVVDLDQYYRGYPIQNQRADFFSRVAMRSRLQTLIRLGLARGQRVLDYGCGNGVFVEFLRQAGFEAEGYDPYTPQFSDRSRLGQFDAVCSQDVIEHVEDPRALAGEFAELLRPNGLLFVGTPNADEVALDRGEALEAHQPYHRHILSQAALEHVCQQAGFQRLGYERRYYGHTWIPFMNLHFMKAYIAQTGGALDVLFEPPAVGRILTSPRLLFLAFAGRAFTAPGNILMAFQKGRPEEIDQTLKRAG